MSINQLSQETFEELCSALEKVPRTLDWKMLMRKGFCSLYSEEDIAMIESSKDLLYDLTHREITLQDLVNALNEIGNKKAVSIIMKGAQKSGVNLQYSGGRPPPRLSTSQPQMFEDSNFSCAQPTEQSETLPPFPVQESKATECAGETSHPGFEAPFNLLGTMIFTFFPCFSAFLYGKS